MSKELDAYMDACAALDKAKDEADRIAAVVQDGAKTLAKSPAHWRIGDPPIESERREGDGMAVDLEWIGISAGTWPHVGTLLVLRQNYLDAVANVENARKALSPNEQSLIAKSSRTGR